LDTEQQAILRAISARLPRAGTPLTPGSAEHWIHRLGLPLGRVLKWEGAKSLKDMVAWHSQWNPALDLRGWVSLLLEVMTMRPSWRGYRDCLLDQRQQEAA
jgi:hypothetical protein